MRQKKITWDVIYKDFKKQYPRMAKRAYGFEAYGYATILIKFYDNIFMTYNYDTKEILPIVN